MDCPIGLLLLLHVLFAGRALASCRPAPTSSGDRALIAFVTATGARHRAVASFRLRDIDFGSLANATLREFT